jgi:hypothetical protein
VTCDQLSVTRNPVKRKSSTQLAPGRRSLSEGGFFSSRALIALLVSVVTFSIVAGPLMAFLRSQASGNASHPAAAGLTFEERVSYQRAIEDVYWRHRI